MKNKLLILFGFSVIAVGCAPLPMAGAAGDPSPLEKAAAPAKPSASAPAAKGAAPTSGCADCASQPQAYYAVAVTRPALCNDYPVEYRVQVPDTDARIRPIDRIVLGDGIGQVKSLACGK